MALTLKAVVVRQVPSTRYNAGQETNIFKLKLIGWSNLLFLFIHILTVNFHCAPRITKQAVVQ